MSNSEIAVAQEENAVDPTDCAIETPSKETDRLIRLQTLLVADASNPNGVSFDLSGWAWRYVWGDEQPVAVDCGTHACAVGLACISGLFAEDGLAYDLSHSGSIVPTYAGWRGWPAVEYFFGLNEDDAQWLFSPEHYVTRHGAEAELMVSARIQQFLGVEVAQ